MGFLNSFHGRNISTVERVKILEHPLQNFNTCALDRMSLIGGHCPKNKLYFCTVKINKTPSLGKWVKRRVFTPFHSLLDYVFAYHISSWYFQQLHIIYHYYTTCLKRVIFHETKLLLNLGKSLSYIEVYNFLNIILI